MAKFENAIQHLFKIEGGYSKHPADPGGETYRGISRRYHPEWVGWPVIDERKRAEGALTNGWTLTELDVQAAEFYRVTYWMATGAWRADVDDAIGVELLDAAVHTNPGRAVEFLQEALNVCNRGGRRWHDLTVDGRLGPKTAKACAIAAGHPEVGEHRIVFTQNLLQGEYLLERVRENPEKEEFFVGWQRRLV